MRGWHPPMAFSPYLPLSYRFEGEKVFHLWTTTCYSAALGPTRPAFLEGSTLSLLRVTKRKNALISFFMSLL